MGFRVYGFRALRRLACMINAMLIHAYLYIYIYRCIYIYIYTHVFIKSRDAEPAMPKNTVSFIRLISHTRLDLHKTPNLPLSRSLSQVPQWYPFAFFLLGVSLLR